MTLLDSNGKSVTSHEDMDKVALYFEHILGTSSEVECFPVDVELPTILENQANELIVGFSALDVSKTLKKMGKNKSPGPDDFPVKFYLSTWHIVGPNVSKGIVFFFNSLNMPRIINATRICLVPKKKNPQKWNTSCPYLVVTFFISALLKCLQVD